MDSLFSKKINFGELYFSLKCKSDALIYLNITPENQDSLNSAYEIKIGSNNNSQTTIKKDDSTYITVDTSNILDNQEKKSFWIKWGAGFLSVGKNLDKDSFIKCSFQNIKHVYWLNFQSYYDAEWVIYKPPTYKKKLIVLHSGPCQYNKLQSVKMNFGMICLNVFGPKFRTKLCSSLIDDKMKELYEVEINTFESCLIKNYKTSDSKSITKTYFSPIHKENIRNISKSQQPICFWLSWFDRCLTMGIENDNEPIISSKLLSLDFHIDCICLMSKWSSMGFFKVYSTKWHGINSPTERVTSIPEIEERHIESEIEQFRFNFERPVWAVINKTELEHYICAAIFGITINLSNKIIENYNNLKKEHCKCVIELIIKYYDSEKYTLGLTLVHYYVKSVKLINLLLRIYLDGGSISFIDLSTITFYKSFSTYIIHLNKLRKENPNQINQLDSIHYPSQGIYIDNLPLIRSEFSNDVNCFLEDLPNLNKLKSRESAFFAVQEHVVNQKIFRTWFPEVENTMYSTYSTYKDGLVTNFFLLGGNKNEVENLIKSIVSYESFYSEKSSLLYTTIKKSKIFDNLNISYLFCTKFIIPKPVNNSPYLNCPLLLIQLSYTRIYENYFYFLKFPERFIVIASDVMSFLLSEIKSQCLNLHFQVLCCVDGINIKCYHPVKKEVYSYIMLNFTMRLAKIAKEPYFIYYSYFIELLSQFSLIINKVTSSLKTHLTTKLIEFCANWIIEKMITIFQCYEESKISVTTICETFNEVEFNKEFCSIYNIKFYSVDSVINHVFSSTLNDITSLINDFNSSFFQTTIRILEPIEPNVSATFFYKVPAKSGPRVYRIVASKKFPKLNFSNHLVFKRFDSENLVYLWSDDDCEYPLVLFKFEKNGIYECGIVIFLKLIEAMSFNL